MEKQKFKADVERNASIALTANQSNLISEQQGFGRLRGVIIITNCNAAGGGTAWLAIGAEAKANSGIPLQAGQTISFAIDSAYKPNQKQITAYTATAGTNIAVYEEIGVDWDFSLN